MSNVFARCTALGLFAGGFALTGDLGWVADRGMRVLNSRSIPADEASLGDEPVAAAAGPEGGGLTRATEPAPLPAASHHDVGPVFQGGDVRPPANGPEQASIAALEAGNRIVVWIAGTPGTSGLRAWRCLVLDVVDPASAEALLYEAVSFSSSGAPIATAAAPRRVRLSGPGGGSVIARGRSFDVRRLGVAAGSDGPADEQVGPVVALAILR